MASTVFFGACSKTSDEWDRQQCLERSREVISSMPAGNDGDSQEAYAKQLQDLNAELAEHKCLGLDEVSTTLVK